MTTENGHEIEEQPDYLTSIIDGRVLHKINAEGAANEVVLRG